MIEMFISRTDKTWQTPTPDDYELIRGFKIKSANVV